MELPSYLIKIGNEFRKNNINYLLYIYTYIENENWTSVIRWFINHTYKKYKDSKTIYKFLRYGLVLLGCNCTILLMQITVAFLLCSAGFENRES